MGELVTATAVEYLTPAEVSRIYKIARGTLANRRSLGTGMPYIKTPAGRILYRARDAEQWVLSGPKEKEEGE